MLKGRILRGSSNSFYNHLGNLLGPTCKLEATILRVHGVISDIDVTLAGVDPLCQPSHITVVLHLELEMEGVLWNTKTFGLTTCNNVFTSMISPTLLYNTTSGLQIYLIKLRKTNKFGVNLIVGKSGLCNIWIVCWIPSEKEFLINEIWKWNFVLTSKTYHSKKISFHNWSLEFAPFHSEQNHYYFDML